MKNQRSSYNNGSGQLDRLVRPFGELSWEDLPVDVQFNVLFEVLSEVKGLKIACVTPPKLAQWLR